MSTPTQNLEGIYDKLVNTDFDNMPNWMRQSIEVDFTRILDKGFQPLVQGLFPKRLAPSVGGKTISYETPFEVSYGIDSGGMAQRVSIYEEPRSREMAYDKERVNAVRYAEKGPTENPTIFKNQYKPLYLDVAYRNMVENAFTSLSRRREYELIRYIRGNQTVMNTYSNQYDKTRYRGLFIDVGAGDELTNNHEWDDEDNREVRENIVEIMRMYEEFTNSKFSLTRMYIGPEVASVLENNSDIIDSLEQSTDVYHNMITRNLFGMNIIKVLGNVRKTQDNIGLRPGVPGVGDLRMDYRNQTTQLPVIREKMIQDDNGEFIILTGPESVGNTYMARASPKHENAMLPYMFEWTEGKLELRKSEIAEAYAPFVQDFERYAIVHNVLE